MIEIDEYARRATESPVAPPPEMARLVAAANRRRRDRNGRRAAFALGLTSVVAVVAIASSLRTNSSGLRVTATTPRTASPTLTIGSSGSHELTVANLTDRLTRAGHTVVADGTASGYPFAAVAQLLCVDGTSVRVYQYVDVAARSAVSAGISPDGSQITLPSTGSTTRTVIIEEWIGPPHFFANGRIIVLVVGDEPAVERALTRILGPTLSPRALPRPSITSPCPTRAP